MRVAQAPSALAAHEKGFEVQCGATLLARDGRGGLQLDPKHPPVGMWQQPSLEQRARILAGTPGHGPGIGQGPEHPVQVAWVKAGGTEPAVTPLFET